MADERETTKQPHTLKLIPTPPQKPAAKWDTSLFTKGTGNGAISMETFEKLVETIREHAIPMCRSCGHGLGEPTFIAGQFEDGTPYIACGCHCHTEVFDPYDLLPSVAG